MSVQTEKRYKAKPFLKWAGGKTQLLPTIDHYLPESFSTQENVTYIEPFVGGGAMLFYMLQKYPNIKKAIINDINIHLVKTYTIIRNSPDKLIKTLTDLQAAYLKLKSEDTRKEFYLESREKFNNGNLNDVEDASFLIFLNRTCFNGLYRENSKGKFNVPFGKYPNPTICDAETILADSELLQKVQILHGDFSQVYSYRDDYTFVYFDPPYRPLDATSSFNSYVKESFNDDEQKRLQALFSEFSNEGCHVLLSNSDGKNRNENDMFFDSLYDGFYIERVLAKRSINANPSKRGKLTELLIRNYMEVQGDPQTLF